MISRADQEGWTATGGRHEDFQVDTDELAHIAHVLSQATDILLRAEETESSGTAIVTDSRAAMPPQRPMRVPAWLHDFERDWRALRDGVLAAHGQATHALRETFDAYLGSDSRVAQALTIDGTAGPDLSRLDGGRTPAPAGLLAAGDAGFPNRGTPPAPAGVRPIGDGDLDTAIELWRRRHDDARTAMEMLRHELTALRWHGVAAAAFTAWTDTHLDRCRTLVDRADTAHTALTSTDPTVPHNIGRPPDPPAPLAFTYGPAQPADSTSATSPTVSPIEAATPASSGALAGSTSETGPNPAVRTPATAPADEHLDDQHLEVVDVASASDGPATAESGGAEPFADQPADDTQALQTAAPLAAHATAQAATWPVAAIATTALFARTDRGRHIVRDIALPATDTPAPPKGALQPATDPRLDGDTAAGGHTAPPGEPGPPGRPMPPFHVPPVAVWINLARAQDPPAWIDLAATRGLGLDGPGAFDIARTVWRRLHDDHPRAQLIAPELLARALLGHTLPRLGADGGVLVVGDPRQGLQASWDEVEQRRAVGLHSVPVVLVAPAPVTASARSDLINTLHALPRAAFIAVLLGPWDTGTTLTITEQHHVSDHRQPASTRAPLTGTRLEPTTLAMHGAPDPLVSDPPDTDGHDRTTAEHPDIPAPAEPHAERTPLALSVLGPVQLRYRRPATDSQPTETDWPKPEEVLTVPGISRPAQELLAYLAAHPGGVTRDAIIEALWPNSTADRPDTAFHTTISRLRKRLRDVTGTDTAGDIITTTDGRWHLNRTQVTVDYWTFLETHPRNPDPALRRRDHHIAVHLYQGSFAADQTGEWTHTIREATRRRYLEALNDLTETEIATNPDVALELLERARNLEPLNEAIYRNIMRIHIAGRRLDAARGVYELLRTHLATIEATPEPATEQLAATAQQGRGAGWAT